MLDRTGVPTKAQVLSIIPKEDDLVSFKAVIECYEKIPCNPCESHCPFDAIHIGENLNDRPNLLVEKCVGCGICVGVCPGLAIMLAKVSTTKATFTIAYEFNPKPVTQEIWHAIDRSGNILGDATILKVVETKKHDHTALITVQTDRTFLHDFITIRSKQHES